jgi:CelD/BcsL family acetyltransferase involved in cellulose biosynthesis
VPLDVQILEKLDAVEAIEPAWCDLWEQDPAATPFQSPDWLVPWMRHLWGGGRLRVLAIRDGNRLPAAEWNVCDLEELRPGCAPLRAQSPEMLDVRDSPCSVCPVVSLPRDFDTLYQILDGRFRRKLRTAEHRLAGLPFDGEIIAVQYNLYARGCCYLACFDPAHARCSPGALLIAHTIRLAMEEGACDRANRKPLVTRATSCGRKIA